MKTFSRRNPRRWQYVDHNHAMGLCVSFVATGVWTFIWTFVAASLLGLWGLLVWPAATVWWLNSIDASVNDMANRQEDAP